jgi:hypothetical protein
MRRTNLIILGVVVLALGAFIVFVERHQPTSDERRERADRVFPALDADEVEIIELRTDAAAVRLVRDDGAWRLTEPLDSPADPAAVLGLLEAIAGLDAERVLGADEVDAAAYGLDDPPIELVLADGEGRRFELAVGGTTPLGGKRAVRRGDADEVVLCPAAFVSRLDRNVDDWRSREVVSVAESELAVIDIETGEDRIRVERVRDRWRLVEPLADLADHEQITSLISELNGLRVTEFLDTGAAPSGIDDPEFRIRLEEVDDGATVTLELAAPADDSAGVVCRRDGEDLFRVPDTLRLRLGKAPVLWRSDAVWPFSTWDVASATFGNPDDEVGLVHRDGMWQLPDGGAADGAEVRRRLSRLAELEADAHDLMVPPTGALGTVTVTTDGEAGSTELRFTFWGAMEEGGHAAVAVTGRDNVMAVDAATVDTIVEDLDALRMVDETRTGE